MLKQDSIANFINENLDQCYAPARYIIAFSGGLDSSVLLHNIVHQKEKKLSHIQKIEHDVDIILDKINREGFDKLSKDEQDQLYEGSRSLSRHKKKD